MTQHNIIRQCRDHANLTQHQLADTLGVTQSTLADRERERYTLALDFVTRVADACGVTICYDGEWSIVDVTA